MDLNAVREFVRVTCLRDTAMVAGDWQATHVVSLLDPELNDELVPRIERVRHHVVRLRDQENPLATTHFPDAITAFFNDVLPAIDADGSRILVHCHAGVSRSTAFAYGVLAHRFGAGREDDAFAALMSIVNKPWPNRRIIEIFDAHWQRDGRLLAPLDAMRQKHPRRIDAWHRFNARRGMGGGYSR
ncbi:MULTISPECIES: dual specificity protein phosphatase family protein [unclassified Rhizobium]|uniref:dual specificity protein phosphatase family protein n=1 Tax=unclassified Rhizobium TaxID=2613769 RepID=UPI00071457A8|nr:MULTISPECIES: dual specificity protein phosphatase family protein [unclassified Rhizobium]KQS99114.1 protein tyrosine phosphatase [Rhizobium sp. Leaf386]KQT91854.1 protein tyrosine phosphatase [Rhizobium sp. Leaf453]